jgi:hypothetical protein
MVASGSAGIARLDTGLKSFMGRSDYLCVVGHMHASFQVSATR